MSAVITANAERMFGERYIAKEVGEKTPRDVFRRCSFGNPDYFRIMDELLYLPNSPTLFNAGLNNGGTSSACFKFDIEDALLGDWPHGGDNGADPDSIIGTMFKAAAVAKAGGGVGYYLGKLRRKNAPVNSTHKKACGPVAVVRFLHGVRSLITQGGKRDLAQMGILPCWHEDILDFVNCKNDDPDALSSFNLSVSWTNDFLTKVDFEGVQFPDQQSYESAIWWAQCQAAWKTGDPGMYFFDTAEQFNPTPHLGQLTGTNPCGEVCLLSNEPCNLGSVSLWRFVVGLKDSKRRVDWALLRETVRVAIRYMDEILDNNVFPHPQITRAAMLTRKLGLGVMGWADMLALLKIPYDSGDAVGLAYEVMRTIDEVAFSESVRLGEKKGAYPAWEAAPDDVKERFPKCRNSTRTCCAPTGTISILANASSGIEPHYMLEWERETYEKIKLVEKISVSEYLQGFIPKTASEIGLEWHVKHQAAFQKHTNLACSKTINLPNSATVKDISDAYRLMWELGCKGGTVFRDGCRDKQVLRAVGSAGNTTVAVGAIPSQTLDRPCQRRRLPKDRHAVVHQFRVGDAEGFLTVGHFEDGSPGEIFLTVSRQGSTIDGVFDTWAIQVSMSLQHGMPLADLIRQHQGRRFEPYGLTGNSDVPMASSIPDYVVRWLYHRYLKKDNSQSPSMKSGNLCPECGQETILQSGCVECKSCGYSKCG